MRFALLEHAPDGVVVVDHAGVIVYANPRAQVLFGYDRDELIGRPHDDLVAKSLAFEHAALRAAFAKAPSVRAMSGGSARVFGRRRDGSEFPVEISLSVMGDADGALVVAFIRDATTMRRLEAERSIAADRASNLSSLAAALGDAVTVAQVAGAILAECARAAGANGALVLQVVDSGRAVDVLVEGGGASGALEAVAESVRGVGFDVTQVAGRRRFAIDAPGPSAEAGRSHAPVWLHDGAEIRRRYPAIGSMLERGDCAAMAALPMVAAGVTIGVLRLSFAGERAFDEDEKVFLSSFARKCGLALDRARLYEESVAARELAERAILLRDEFLSIVAHDLGSPLSVIGLWARLIHDVDSTPAGAATVKKGADKIALGVDRIARLLHDLGDVSSIDAGHLSMKREQHDLSAIVTETVESLAPVCAAKGLSIHGNAPPTLLWCDPNRVQQVLGNLVGNAIKFTPDGGRIEVDASTTPWEVLFSVLDTGPGIPDQARAHVFDRYWRGKARDVTVGVGLGLFISKGIVEAHGGRIWVEPVAGGGSRFCFTLPIGAPAARGSSALAV
jgi:PAS domain S-box-containing protein